MQDDLALPVFEISKRTMLGRGISGMVFLDDDEQKVVKMAPVWDNEYASNEGLQDLLIERSIYQRLGSHPRICQYISSVQRGIVLERYGDLLRKRLLQLHVQRRTPSPTEALKWSCQVAEGIAYLHQNGVIQGDIGCHNILLNRGEVKLCDFGGSSIDGTPATVGYECRSQRWDDKNPSIQSELFALGSTLYEIWTTTRPYQDQPDDVVKQHYKSQNFPDVSSLPVAGIINKCWYGTYSSADEVVADLKSLQTKNRAILAAFTSIVIAIMLAAWVQPYSDS